LLAAGIAAAVAGAAYLPLADAEPPSRPAEPTAPARPFIGPRRGLPVPAPAPRPAPAPAPATPPEDGQANP